MSGSLLTSVAGGVIGFAVGGPLGAQIGFAAGSVAGSLLFPTTVQGPRLADRSVSTYGTTIPIVYGGVRIHGNVIWSTDLIENKSSSSGKGGPKQTTYTYSVSVAILLCEGPISSIRRVWADTKLVYDSSSDADADTKSASAAFLKYMTFYAGTEDQMPDPVMEADKGVGNVPAYRGHCYVVLDKIPLADYGNRIPDFSFETFTDEYDKILPLVIHPWEIGDSQPKHSGDDSLTAYVTNVRNTEDSTEHEEAPTTFTFDQAIAETHISKVYSGFASLADAAWKDNSAFTGNASLGSGSANEVGSAEKAYGIYFYKAPQAISFTRANAANSGRDIFSFVRPQPIPLSDGAAFYDGVWRLVYQSSNRYEPPNIVNNGEFKQGIFGTLFVFNTGNTYPVDSPDLAAFNSQPDTAGLYFQHHGYAVGYKLFNYYTGGSGFYNGGIGYGNSDGSGTLTQTVYNINSVDVSGSFGQTYSTKYTIQSNGIVVTSVFSSGVWYSTYGCENIRSIRWPSVPLRVFGQQNYERYEVPGGLITEGSDSSFKERQQLAAIEYRNGKLYQNALGPIIENISTDSRFQQNGVFQQSLLDQFWAAERSKAIAAGTLAADVTSPVSWRNIGCARLKEGVVSGPKGLDVIVADICTRAGCSVSEIDVSALAGIAVDGYTIGKQAAARGALQPLQQAFLWDFVESGAALKAVRRGTDPVLTIPLDDLGATADASAAAPVETTRGQESELPSVVNVSYASRITGYLTQTQYARRDVVDSQQVTSIDTAVVMTDAKAAEVAAVLLYNAWTERNQRSFATTRKYAALEPTDVVTLTDQDGLTYDVRITSRNEDGGVLKFGAVDEKPASYTQPAAAAAAIVSTSSVGGIAFAGDMVLQLMDIPILRDADDNAGYYAAAAGTGKAWSSGDVFRSTDGGTTYTDVQTISRVATIGTVPVALGGFDGGNVVDERNTLTVDVASGSLSSITRVQLLAKGNAALIGDEIVCFQRAALVSPSVYLLSGLLRGRRGTEAAIGAHVAGERFVLLDANTVYRLSANVGDISAPALYKGVTAGTVVDTATAQSFTDHAVGLRPFSPVDARAVRNDAGDITLTWKRRTRMSSRYIGFPVVPLGEASESYDIEVLAGSTVKRTLTSSTPGVTYTAAQQAADFGAPQTSISVRVYQNSATVGRSLPLAAVVAT